MTGSRPHGESRRRALVEAAFHCIATRGFEGLRVREVAREVGIDHSTVHHYFATKEDLVAAVVEFSAQKFWLTMPPQASAAATIRHHLAVMARMVREEPQLFAVLRELDLRAARDDAIREIVTRNEQGWRDALCKVLADAAPGIDTASGAALIMAVARGVSLSPDVAPAVFKQLELLLDLSD